MCPECAAVHGASIQYPSDGERRPARHVSYQTSRKYAHWCHPAAIATESQLHFKNSLQSNESTVRHLDDSLGQASLPQETAIIFFFKYLSTCVMSGSPT